jgi:hypothetical protein
MSKLSMPWGEAIQVLSASLDHYNLLLQREEELRKNGSAQPILIEAPYSTRDIRRAWKRMLCG